MIFERARENAKAMAQMGQRAIAESKALGVPAYYVDPTLGAGIIKELPDGTRQRVERIEGKEIVLETLGPSAGNPGLALPSDEAQPR
jgi:hypothetical protein